MLEGLFGNANIERILLFLLKNDRCYASLLMKRFNCSISTIQNSLERLEQGGVLVSFLEGKTRIYNFNPRYPFLMELKTFLNKAYEFLPEELKTKYYEPVVRSRPRKKGKLD
jgi:predicted transcriptional regulator